jgi:DNA-directed RNA polymerase subunit RPC12/RpoP
MWRCTNCGTGIEDKYAHCWQCGSPNVLKQTQQARPRVVEKAPQFASYEELAHVPSRPPWILRRGPLQRLTMLVALSIFFKVAASRVVGTYGLYVVIGVAVIALILILWGFFRRDPSEGVGIKLN